MYNRRMTETKMTTERALSLLRLFGDAIDDEPMATEIFLALDDAVLAGRDDLSYARDSILGILTELRSY